MGAQVDASVRAHRTWSASLVQMLAAEQARSTTEDARFLSAIDSRRRLLNLVSSELSSDIAALELVDEPPTYNDDRCLLKYKIALFEFISFWKIIVLRR